MHRAAMSIAGLSTWVANWSAEAVRRVPEVTLHADADASLSGRFILGKLHGRATQILASGDRYEGLFKDDQRHGLGSLIWIDGRRYEGEWAAGAYSGLGAWWDQYTRLTHCGRWKDSKFLESCAVPIRLLPGKRWLSDHAKTASLLFPDGGYFVGPINAQNQRHGEGSMFSAKGSLLSSGVWINDQLQSSSVSAQIAPAPPAAAAAASSSSSSSAVSLPLKCSNRKALLIGNSKYDAPVSSLSCCTNDAEDMQSALHQLGFQCTRLLNASRKQINEALITFIQSLQPNDIVFLHYSGHGEESAGVTYLVPTDYGRSKSLEDDAVSLNKIMQRLNQKNCDLINIIMLDCCRANAQDDTFRGSDEIMRSAMSAVDDRAGQSFVRKPASGHFFIAYSSDPGTVAFETKGARNGWFTGCVLRHLLTPGLRITEIFGMAADSMEEKHGKKQRSWLEHTNSHKKNIVIRPH